MIINAHNKDDVIKNNIKIKKGFNQTPSDVVQNISENLRPNNREERTTAKDTFDPLKYKNTLNNLNRLTKKL